MTDHGILMKGEMVRAYFAGLKWMTRRTRGLDEINKNPDDWKFKGFNQTQRAIFLNQYSNREKLVRPPYGWLGDILWFKETYAVICKEADPFCFCTTDEEEKANHYIEYRSDTNNLYPGDWPEEEARGSEIAPKWKSSMFMPRKYSRITVPVTNVRIERLYAITRADIDAEGTPPIPNQMIYKNDNYQRFQDFRYLWDSINAKRGMGWDFNPWVFIYEFPKYSNLEENAVQKGKV